MMIPALMKAAAELVRKTAAVWTARVTYVRLRKADAAETAAHAVLPVRKPAVNVQMNLTNKEDTLWENFSL